MFNLLVASAALFSVVSGAAIERASTACYTTHTGVLQISDAQPFGLNQDHIVVYPAGSTKLNVHLQACPKSKYATYDPSDESYGARLVAVPGGSVKSNQCVTLLASPTTTEYSYLHLATCGDSTSPPASQSFALETNDFGHEITFVGKGSPEGVAENTTTGEPLTTKGTNQIKIWGAPEVGESYGTFVLHGYTG